MESRKPEAKSRKSGHAMPGPLNNCTTTYYILAGARGWPKQFDLLPIQYLRNILDILYNCIKIGSGCIKMGSECIKIGSECIEIEFGCIRTGSACIAG